MDTPKLLIVDDHPLFRAALVQALGDGVPGAVMIEAASLRALEQALAEHADLALVLLDLGLPGARGLSSLVYLRGERPEVPVLVVSSNDAAQTVRRTQQFGAAGFVSKSAPAATIAAAIGEVLEGGQWFPELRAGESGADARLAAQLAQLTPQQFRVLMCLADGLLNKQIADALGLAENTVKVHVTAILKKLGCYSRTQAAVLVKALDAGEQGGHAISR